MYSFEDGLRTDAARAAPRTGFGEAGGEDALPYIWADVIATMAVWPAGLARRRSSSARQPARTTSRNLPSSSLRGLRSAPAGTPSVVSRFAEPLRDRDEKAHCQSVAFAGHLHMASTDSATGRHSRGFYWRLYVGG